MDPDEVLYVVRPNLGSKATSSSLGNPAAIMEIEVEVIDVHE